MASTPTRLRVDVNSSGFRKCESQKVGYATYAAALDAAELMMEQGKVKPGCHITPYECPDCGEHHVGNRVIIPRQWQ
jgi:hypothetical protein